MKSIKKPAAPLAPTEAQFKAFQGLFDYFNERLFEGKLPAVILNLSRMNKAIGFFAPNRWQDVKELAHQEALEVREGEEVAVPEVIKMHEISLNPDHLSRGAKNATSTLVHEMCHLQRQIAPGKPCAKTYRGHDKQWAEMMKAVGLQPYNIKNPDKETGPSCSHNIVPGGAFEVCFEELPKELLLPFVHIRVPDKDKAAKAASKTKYTCPECETNAWAKPDTNIYCGDCDCKMRAKDE